jgi:5'-phosphate synthase pdxT subunit
MRVGVLAIQGDVREHVNHLKALGADAPLVRLPQDVEGLDGLIMPGGESTTIGLLMQENGLLGVLKERAQEGFPIYGTCAGLILLAQDVEGPPPPRLEVLDITASRNAYGRQVSSCETLVDVPDLGSDPFPAVFIRAPRIVRVGPGVKPLAVWQGDVVMVEQGALLASAFHPELTEDLRIHRYFLHKVEEARAILRR